MTSKDLKRLRRADLLEMLLELSRENDKLRQDNQELRRQLDDRTIVIEKSGSLAEAALQLNGVFEAAQEACEQYIQNIQSRSQNMQQYCQQMEQQTQKRCREMIAKAREEVQRCQNSVQQSRNEQTDTYAWLSELMNNGETE